MKKFIGIFVLIIIVISVLYISSRNMNSTTETAQINYSNSVRYIPIGDSYTIGLGVSEVDNWPSVLTKNLSQNGNLIELVENPAVSGYTVRNAIEFELPIIQKEKPNFVTILIGANDNFAEGDVNVYRSDLKELLDGVQDSLAKKENIVLITIPDYTKTPAAKNYPPTEKNRIEESIKKYNQVIKEEAENRNLKLADIFPHSQTMTDPSDYISDGLHPSAQGYAKWEKIIYPVVLELINQKEGV